MAWRARLVTPQTRPLPMPMTLDAVAAFATDLPGVTVGTKWGNRTWMVVDRSFAWQRPLRRADHERLGDARPPAGDILAVCVENLDAKDALLAMAPPGYFTIAHFNNYPAVLIALKQARVKDVRASILDAFELIASRVTLAKSARRKPRSKP